MIALLLLLEPVKRLVGIHNIFEQALGASQKVFEYLDHEETIAEKPGAAQAGRLPPAASSSTTSRSTIRRAPNGFQLQAI